MEHFYEILWSIIATVSTGIATWLLVVITNWLNNKIKDKKLAKIATDVATLIVSVVQKTFQTYVNTLKDNHSFGIEEQKSAKAAAIAEIKRQLTDEQASYIKSISEDIEAWLSIQIESAIYSLKNK